jgi:hypothetical protein
MSKTNDFNTIVLAKEELKCLKKINKSKIPSVINQDIMFSLVDYSLIKQVITGQDDYGTPITDGSCEINDKGKRYLIFLKQKARPSKAEWIRYGITTIIAIAALIVSIIALKTQLPVSDLLIQPFVIQLFGAV